MPVENNDDQTSKRSKRKRLMDVASKVVDMLVSAADEYKDIHYMMMLVIDTLNYEEACPGHDHANEEPNED